MTDPLDAASTWWAVRPWWKRVLPWWLSLVLALGPVLRVASGASRGWLLLLDALLLALVAGSVVVDVRRRRRRTRRSGSDGDDDGVSPSGPSPAPSPSSSA